MKSILCICFVYCGITAFAQNGAATSATITEVIQRIGHEWKADSLGTTGYRYNFLTELVSARPDSINKELLIQKLGKPQRIQKFYSGNTNKHYVEYIYLVL